MISPSLNFEEFANSVMHKEHLSIIYLAEQEAVEAWRLSNKKNGSPIKNIEKSYNYQTKLLSLIDYMRYKIRLSDCDKKDFILFNKIYESNPSKKSFTNI